MESIPVGIAPEGGYWAKRGGVKPIAKRAHQIKTLKYLIGHRNEGEFAYLHTACEESIYAPRKW